MVQKSKEIYDSHHYKVAFLETITQTPTMVLFIHLPKYHICTSDLFPTSFEIWSIKTSNYFCSSRGSTYNNFHHPRFVPPFVPSRFILQGLNQNKWFFHLQILTILNVQVFFSFKVWKVLECIRQWMRDMADNTYKAIHNGNTKWSTMEIEMLYVAT